MQEALKVLGFTEEECRDMFKLLSGVLQLGNMEFMLAGGAQITTKQGQAVAQLKRFRKSRVKFEWLHKRVLFRFQWSVTPVNCWVWTPSSSLKS